MSEFYYAHIRRRDVGSKPSVASHLMNQGAIQNSKQKPSNKIYISVAVITGSTSAECGGGGDRIGFLLTVS